jgi:tetratricopeptide (TPR) repeat protein
MKAPRQFAGPAPLVGIHLMENHDEAYRIWSRAGVRDRVLVHIDAHDDVVWAADEASINIASYICPALREGIVREVFWVIPDETWKSPKGIRNVIQRLKKVRKKYPGEQQAPIFAQDRISTSFLGKPLQVCPLALLPRFGKPVLLDIDVDYLVIPQAYRRQEQPAAMPWRWPADLVSRLRASGLESDLITIAYSVEGGYTPLKWKYLGDELARRLAGESQDSAGLRGMELLRQACLAAHRGGGQGAERLYLEARELLPECGAPSLHLAHLYADRGEVPQAREFYQEALARDPSFRTAYNSAGIEYYCSGRLPEAAKEYQRTLMLDPRDPYAHLGLGKIAARRKHWQEAETWGQKSLTLDDKIVDTYRLLGEALARQGRRREAIAAYERSLKLTLAGQKPLKATVLSNPEDHRLLDPDHSRVHLLLARLYAREGMADTAIVSYRLGIALGSGWVMPHWHLACLYGKKGHWQQFCNEIILAIKKIPADLQIVYKSCYKSLKNWLQDKFEALAA